MDHKSNTSLSKYVKVLKESIALISQSEWLCFFEGFCGIPHFNLVNKF